MSFTIIQVEEYFVMVISRCIQAVRMERYLFIPSCLILAADSAVGYIGCRNHRMLKQRESYFQGVMQNRSRDLRVRVLQYSYVN